MPPIITKANMSMESLSLDESDIFVCEIRKRRVSISELRYEKDSLKFKKLQSIKEYELCETACKATHEKHEKIKAARAKQFLDDATNKSSCDPTTTAQLSLDCWLAFDFQTRPVPAVTVTPPTGEDATQDEISVLPPISRVLTPYPATLESNERVKSSRSGRSPSPIDEAPSNNRQPLGQALQTSPSKAHVSFVNSKDTISSNPLNQEDRRVPASSTLTIHAKDSATSLSGISKSYDSHIQGTPPKRYPSSTSKPRIPTIVIPPQNPVLPTTTLDQSPPALKLSNPNEVQERIPHPDYTKVTFFAYHLAKKEFDAPETVPEPNLGFWDTIKATYKKEREVELAKREIESERKVLVDEIKALRAEVTEWEGKCCEKWAEWKRVGGCSVEDLEAFLKAREEAESDKGKGVDAGWKWAMLTLLPTRFCEKYESGRKVLEWLRRDEQVGEGVVQAQDGNGGQGNEGAARPVEGAKEGGRNVLKRFFDKLVTARGA